MKIGFILFFFLVNCFSSTPIGFIFNSAFVHAGMDSFQSKSKTQVHKKIKSNGPFQGKKVFCSADSDAKFSVTITGNKVLIVMDNKKITGVYKKDKLFTNDPEELEYRKFAPKNNYGKFYVIATDYFSVLNSENSEYRYFTLCK